jgi:hypothetical protein
MKLLQGIPLTFLLMLALQASAKTTNPADLVIDGGESLYAGKSETTQLFVDESNEGKRIDFWVKVTVNPGILIPLENPIEPPVQEPIRTYIKYFPLNRYLDVLNQLKKIHHFGVVNPYIDGAVICDGPNSTLRLGKKQVIMAYNCGADAHDAETATFNAEALMKALRTETLQDADLQGVVPDQQ